MVKLYQKITNSIILIMAVIIIALGAIGLMGYRYAYNYVHDQIIIKAKTHGYRAEIEAVRFKREGIQVIGIKLKSYSDRNKVIHINKVDMDYDQSMINAYGMDIHAKNLDDLLEKQEPRDREGRQARSWSFKNVNITTDDFSTTDANIILTEDIARILMMDGFTYEKNGRKIEAKGVEILPRFHALKAREIYITKTEVPIKQISNKSIGPIKEIRRLINTIPDFYLTYEFGTGSIQEKFFEISFTTATGRVAKKGNSLELNLESETLSQGSLLSLENPKIKMKLNPNDKDDGSFIIEVHGDSATTKNDAIVNDTIKSKEFKIAVNGHAYNMFQIGIDGQLSIGNISISGEVSTSPNFEWSLATPELQCSDVIEYLPSSIISQLSEAKYEGTIELTVNGDIKGNEPTVSLKVKNKCKVVSFPEVFNVEKFKSKFDHTIYTAKGKLDTIEMGPGSNNWTDLAEIPGYMELAVMNSEDPGFYRHKGISYIALQDAVKDNILHGGFLRGASTISMQLAKNLWLMREKTIARKIQEAFLVTYLEQELTKKQIMELYLNVIEYGPNVYGIKNAAKYYFQTLPHNLSLAQCVFLASILPSPKTSYFNSDGTLGERRAQYVRKLLHLMSERDMITNEELEAGLEESLVFGKSNIKTKAIKIAENGMTPSEWN